MLEDCLFETRSSVRSKKPATVALSVLVHGTIAGALILIPLFQTQLLPQVAVFEPLQPPVAPGRMVELVAVPGRPPSGGPVRVQEPKALIEPITIPTTIPVIVDDPLSSIVGALPSQGGDNGNSPFGLPFEGGIPGREQATPPPPPPAPPTVPPRPPEPEPAPTAPVRVGGALVQSNLVNTVQPVYPRLAIVARVQGAVILEAVITRDGTIDTSRLRVLTGHPLLDQAAIDAVRQWRYRPTLLNGVPVEVLTTITVNFTLN